MNLKQRHLLKGPEMSRQSIIKAWMKYAISHKIKLAIKYSTDNYNYVISNVFISSNSFTPKSISTHLKTNCVWTKSYNLATQLQ